MTSNIHKDDIKPREMFIIGFVVGMLFSSLLTGIIFRIAVINL